MKQTLRIILASFLATAAVIKAAPALADPAARPMNVSVVHTADLDLSTDGGRRHLYQRLTIAAREVCGTASDSDLEGRNAARHCRDEVLARVQQQRDVVMTGQPIAITATR